MNRKVIIGSGIADLSVVAFATKVGKEANVFQKTAACMAVLDTSLKCPV